jgi:hypothetical protein
MHNRVNRKIKRLSESRSFAAKIRWKRDRERRVRLDALDPIRVGGKIIERLVRVIGEDRVIERTFYEFDLPCDWKRKRREVFLAK